MSIDIPQTIAVLLSALILQVICLAFAILTDSYLRKEQRVVLLLVDVLALCMILQDVVSCLLVTRWQNPPARTAVAVFGYVIRPLILVLFLYVVNGRRSYWPAWALLGVNTLVHLTAFFSGVCFAITPDNRFLRGPLGYICHGVSALLLAALLCLTVREYRSDRGPLRWFPLFHGGVVVAAVILDSTVHVGRCPISFLTAAVVVSCVFYYVWLHLRLVRGHEKDLMAEQRIQIMMSQIQPHFLYNTLSTIQTLCLDEPEKAFDTIAKFGVYLRQNLESLDQPKLIPLTRELDHTRVYAEIEQIRFPSIEVSYDIRDAEFSLPALTIQPLVENAIRHGVRIRERGRVWVRAYRDKACHVVVVGDNGKGLDLRSLEKGDGTSHIGIQNVRERVERMCGGTMTIDSVLGEGTTVTLRFPERGDKR